MSKELKWSQNLGSLTSRNIKWQIRDWEIEDIITNCGDFPNVPLLENFDLMIRLNQTTLLNEHMEDDRQNKDKELEANNKRARESDEKSEQFGHYLKGTKFVFKTKNQELDQAKYKIQDLNKMVDRVLEIKREARLISKIHVRELKDAL